MLALKENGEVWAWGANDEEQLGQPNSQKHSLAPIQITLPAKRKAIQVSGGERHSLVLLDDHTVLSFGGNREGQLGREGKSPSVIDGLTNITAISAGGRHSLVLKKDGTVWAFGSNCFGQLGDGTRTQQTKAVQIQGINHPEANPVVAVAAGLESSYALTQEGTVLAWGANSSGQLGDGSKTDSPSPVAVKNLSGIIAIVAGYHFAGALKNDGTVWSWGVRSPKQGERKDRDSASPPQQVVEITDAIRIAAGSEHIAIVRLDGSMWTLGSNSKGQLAVEKAWPGSMMTSPQASVLKSDVEKVTAGIDSTYALKKDGTISAFGSFQCGQMGDGSFSHATPVQMYEERGASKIACGASHSVVLRADGSVGWLGFYNTHNPSVEEQNPHDPSYQLKILSSLGNIIQVASGDQHTVALRSDGTVWAYGMGNKGQLGNSKFESSMMPVQVAEITGAKAVAAGGDSSLAIISDDSVVTWGSNNFGQLGDGTTMDRSVPVAISKLTQVTAAAMGKDHALLIRKEDGTVWIWGDNKDEQLVGNKTPILSVPQQVPGLSHVKAVAAGEGFSLALLENKSVVAWGVNHFGQLGLGDTPLHSTPTAIPHLTDVEQIAAGSSHVIARLKNGTLKAWGSNDLGQVGDGTFTNQLSPVAVKELTSITDISAGKSHSFAVRGDHTAWSWGNNANEQLGVSATRQHRSAIRLVANSADTDADGIPDGLERTYFGNLFHNGAADSDGDGWNDSQEILLGTNPILADTDSDNLTDIADSSPRGNYEQAGENIIASIGDHRSMSGPDSALRSKGLLNSEIKKTLIIISNSNSHTSERAAHSENNSDQNEDNVYSDISVIFPANGEVLECKFF